MTIRRRELEVSLREISAETVVAVTRLTVAEDQQGFVAPNAVSLAQALFAPDAPALEAGVDHQTPHATFGCSGGGERNDSSSSMSKPASSSAM